MHTATFPLAEDMAASAAAESWIFPMHPVPAQQPADQSRNDSVAIGCKHAYYLERTVFFLQVLRAIHVAFISFLIIDGWVVGWVGYITPRSEKSCF